MSKTYDMSTSDKWASLADGEHTVQIVAKGSGYKDSEKSAGVTVSKGEGVTDSLFVSDFDTRTQLSVVEQTAAGDETWAGIIYDNYGNIVLLAPRGVLTFVSYKVSSTAYTDVKTRLTNAYTTIDNATSLFELNSEIEDYIRSLNPDLTADDFKVAYLDDISLSDDYNDCLLQGNVMTVVLNMDTSKNYIVMYSEDGQSNWGLLDSAQVEVTSDGILLYLDTAPLVLAILEQQ